MKKILSILAILAILSSCKDLLSDDMNKEDLIEVKLSLTGDVTVKEEPLTKAFDSNDLIAIQVYHENNVYNVYNVYNGYSSYAYGLFDDMSDLKIYLHSGTSYSIKALMIKNGKNTQIPFSNYIKYTRNGYGYFGYSDWGLQNTDGIAAVKYYAANTNSYRSINISNNFFYTNQYTSSQYYFNMPNRVFYPISDSYYGELSIDNISGDANTLSIEMKHLVYRIQCNVTGVTDGTASITIKNGDNVLLEKTDISGEYHSDELLFSCSSLYDAWQYADNYTENVTVSMTWLRGVGVLQDLGSQVVQVKRNSKNVINVSLSTSLSSPEIIAVH